MAREKINISIDADLLKDIDVFIKDEDRPSRSNAIEVLIRRGFKLPIANALLGLGATMLKEQAKK